MNTVTNINNAVDILSNNRLKFDIKGNFVVPGQVYDVTFTVDDEPLVVVGFTKSQTSGAIFWQIDMLEFFELVSDCQINELFRLMAQKHVLNNGVTFF
jgi:hypothetical protein